MSWKYRGAVLYGNAADPQKGDRVVVSIEDDADPENVQTKEFPWTFDGTQSKAAFIAMVKQEMKAHLQHLNRATESEDASAVFEPE